MEGRRFSHGVTLGGPASREMQQRFPTLSPWAAPRGTTSMAWRGMTQQVPA